MPIKAYLDTCIVSGLVKGDLNKADEAALVCILQAGKAGVLELVTSDVTATELSQIPAEHRLPHEAIYYLLADVRCAKTHRTDSGLMLMGVGGGRREDPLLAELRNLLPDDGDANHVFQAACNSVSALITVDRKSFLSRAEQIVRICGVRVVTPGDFVREHLDGASEIQS